MQIITANIHFYFNGSPKTVNSRQTKNSTVTKFPSYLSESDDDTTSISVSECSDSDFEARITKRKRGSKFKKHVARSERSLILQRYKLATAAPIEV